MNTTETIVSIPPDLAAELREALDDLVTGVRRPEKCGGLRTHGSNPRGELQAFR